MTSQLLFWLLELTQLILTKELVPQSLLDNHDIADNIWSFRLVMLLLSLELLLQRFIIIIIMGIKIGYASGMIGSNQLFSVSCL